MFPTFLVLGVVTGVYLALGHLRREQMISNRSQIISNIYTTLNKNNNQQLDSTEVLLLKNQGTAVPTATTLDGLATALQDLFMSDLQKLLENL